MTGSIDNYDAVIIGAGPVGIATAATLKAIHKEAKILVADKRTETRRHYGLSVARDSIKYLADVLQRNSESEEARELEKLFRSWSGTVKRVSFMEDTLADRARELGVTVERDEKYKNLVTKQGVWHSGLLPSRSMHFRLDGMILRHALR